VLTHFRRIGQREREASALLNLALAALHSDQPERTLELATQALPMLQAAGSHWMAAAAMRIAGQAALAMGTLDDAVAQLHAACSSFGALQLRPMAAEAQASLALALQAKGDAAGALRCAHEVLDQLDSGMSLEGTEEPLRVYADCWQVLQAAHDARAAPCLQQALQLLNTRAQRLADATRRHSFLRRVPHHRMLCDAAEAGLDTAVAPAS
jgi:tetratricopeptide (TPR) repeat protein